MAQLTLPTAVKRGAVAVLGRPEARADAEKLGVRFIVDENPRASLAKFAAALVRRAAVCVVAAVTGTNGKTSVAAFLHARSGSISAATLRAWEPSAW